MRSTIIVSSPAVSKWRRCTGHHASLNSARQPNGYEFRRCFTEDRGEGVEKSGGFHQEFVKEVSFRKGNRLLYFANKTRRTCTGPFSYHFCLLLGREGLAQAILS
jgi:hypothetical protein